MFWSVFALAGVIKRHQKLGITGIVTHPSIMTASPSTSAQFMLAIQVKAT